MDFDTLLAQITELLQRQGRVSYGALKRRFNLDEAYLQDLKDELIGAQRLAVDEDGKILVWAGSVGEEEPGKRRIGESERKQIHSSSDSGRRTSDAGLNSAERRQLTVMFCDLVGSTALSTQLDPEDLREVVRTYQQTCAEVIQRYDGHIAQYLGDGLLVYFGYPVAHEDDAVRAVWTSLSIVDAIQTLTTSGSHPLQVRIGIHTGPVVVGEIGSDGRQEQLALGETPNIAARVQGQAAPNEVVVSAATLRLIRGLFETEDRGQQALKGISTPLTLYRVVRGGEAQSRFEAAVRTGLTPLVGREEEIALLHRRWERAKAGEGQVVQLSGEPGIGKSRLVQVLREQTARETLLSVECRCSPYTQNSALYPVIEHLQRWLRFERNEPPEAKFRKLEQTLTVYGFALPDTVPLLASLLSLPVPDTYAPLQLSPQRQKEKTLELLVTLFRREAERQPLRVEVEDLHWADPSTVEFLTLLVEQVPTMRALLILTFRPEFTLPWPLRAHTLPLHLDRLSQQEIAKMARQVAGKALPPEVVQQVVTKADGIPLFIEELTKAVVESGHLQETEDGYEVASSLPQFTIPTTLHDALAARLDRLNSAREVAQCGAVIGREFSYPLLQAIAVTDEEPLVQGLRQLVDAELIYQRGVLPEAHYTFKHALIQDAAYQSLLRSTRQQLHQRVAQALIERFPETVETQPELLAYHYTVAGLGEQALPYWQQAGQRATHRSSHAEALSHLNQGLEVIKTLPDTPEHAQQELTLQIALGAPLMDTKGYASPEVEKTYGRARELCRQIGETPQLFPVLFGLWYFYVARPEIKTARELAEQLLTLAHRTQEPTLLSVAHFALGLSLFWSGELTQAQAILKQGATPDNSQKASSPELFPVQDTRVTSSAMEAWVLWQLGYPDQAHTRVQESLIFAQEMSYPFSIAYALAVATIVSYFRGEWQLTQQRAETLIALSTEQGFPIWLALGTMARSWGLASLGQVEEGIAQARQALANWQESGMEANLPYILSSFAEVYASIGQVSNGLEAIQKGLTTVNNTSEHMWESELHRLKGELMLKQSEVRSPESEVPNIQHLAPNTQLEAEACFLNALAIARTQHAKSLELRAATSLARLWQQQGKKAEAHQLLSEIYNWFTEGFDTKDLQEAKALLDDLT